MAKHRLVVNGKRHSVESWDPDQPLLYVLRNALGLHGPKFGCGLGQCGSCTVLIDGEPTRSCLTGIAAVAGKSVTTLEGLGSPEQPHPVQAAFIAEQAAQCGYCSNGMVMSVVALLKRTPRPTPEQIKSALAGNLCRCGSHDRVLRAVQRAANQSAMRKA
jgi:nicotinate dehydrogenase subunit A